MYYSGISRVFSEHLQWEGGGWGGGRGSTEAHNNETPNISNTVHPRRLARLPYALLYIHDVHIHITYSPQTTDHRPQTTDVTTENRRPSKSHYIWTNYLRYIFMVDVDPHVCVKLVGRKQYRRNTWPEKATFSVDSLNIENEMHYV